METSVNPYAAPSGDIIEDFLLVDGNVNIGKNKGQGQLLFTRTSIFALRSKNDAAMAFAMAGLIGLLINYIIKKYFTKKPEPSPHLTDPEILNLPEKTRKRTEPNMLITKLPITPSLQVERTTLGVKITSGSEPPLIYQGMTNKSKISQFLTVLGIQVR